MNRPKIAHILKSNKSTNLPTRFIFFDTETKQIPIDEKETLHKFWFGVLSFSRYRKSEGKFTESYKVFREIDKFWEIIESKFTHTTKIIMVAHNLAYDMKVLEGFRQLKERGWKINTFIDNNMTNIWEFRKGKKKMLFLDNTNYFSTSLDSLGDSIGIEKLKMPSKNSGKDTWERYCTRDVKVMIKAWEKWFSFIGNEDLGTWGKTMATQAFNAFRHRFMPEKVYIHNNSEAIELERDSYFGGRTECFYIGETDKGKYYKLDVNSMYPSVMREFKYPTKLIKIYHRLPVDKLKSMLKDKCFVARVKLETEQPIYPKRRDNKLIFPTGEFQTVLTTRELTEAIHRGHLKEVIKANCYESEILFNEYVNYFYRKRMRYKYEGNPAFAYLCKLLLNSLYGKFGQLNEVWETVKKDTDYPDNLYTIFDADEEEFTQFRCINGKVEKKEGYKEGFHSLVSVASHVTADARMLLWSYIEEAGKNHVYYCDTDSLFVDSIGHFELQDYIDDTTIGLLEVEGKSKGMKIYSLKDYEFGDEKKMKGIRKDAKKIGERRYLQDEFEGIRSGLLNGRLNEMIVKKVEKELSRNYDKGEIQNNGRVKPIQIHNFDINLDDIL